MIAFRGIIPLLVGTMLLFAEPATAAVQPPYVGARNLYDIAIPEAPFDRRADAVGAVDHALSEARATNRRVLIDLGANWCANCRILAGIMELPEVRRFLDAYFVVVHVDVGRFDRNLEIPARFGLTDRLEGVPAILIADGNGYLLNGGQTGTLVTMSDMSPQAVVDWFARWAR